MTSCEQNSSGPPCALCGSRGRQTLHRQVFGLIVRCSSCGLVSATSDRGCPIRFSYGPEYFRSLRTDKGGAEGYWDYFGVEWEDRGRISDGLATLLLARQSSGRALDIGCGGGQLLNRLQRAGMECEGIEISEHAASRARRLSHVDVFTGSLRDYVRSHPAPHLHEFDLEMMIDVLEHLPNPVTDLALARSSLAPDGLVFVSTPLYGGRLSRTQGEAYFQFKRDHVHYFSRETLRGVLEKAGYSNIDVMDFSELTRGKRRDLPRVFISKYTSAREHVFAFARA